MSCYVSLQRKKGPSWDVSQTIKQKAPALLTESDRESYRQWSLFYQHRGADIDSTRSRFVLSARDVPT